MSKLVDRIGTFTTVPNSFIENFKGTAKAKWLFVILRDGDRGNINRGGGKC